MTTRKAIDSIHSKLDKIALKGKDNYLEYSNYFKDLSANGNYDNLLQCLYIHYLVDIEKPIININTFRRDSWKSILFKTDSNINKRTKKLYDNKKVYQTGFDIWSSDPNLLTITLSNPLSTTFSSTNLSKGISFNNVNTATQSYINMNILNNGIYKLDIQKAVWATSSVTNIYLPSKTSNLQSLIGSTQSGGFLQYSSYKTEVATDHSAQFLVTTHERARYDELGNKTGEYRILNYKLELSKDNYLGQIIEQGIYTDEYKYLLKNREYARITKTRKTFLEVIKVGASSSVIIDQDDLRLSEDNNLYNRYVIAINLLLS
jgi:hypothetical protein